MLGATGNAFDMKNIEYVRGYVECFWYEKFRKCYGQRGNAFDMKNIEYVKGYMKNAFDSHRCTEDTCQNHKWRGWVGMKVQTIF